MPIYEYQCDVCGRRFDRIQKFSDPPVEVCPTCGGHVHKLISSPAFQFKGSGWYITDYARKDSATTEKGGEAKEGSAAKEGGGAEKDGAAKKEAPAASGSSETSSSTSKTKSKEE